MANNEGIRLQVYLAKCGIGSRRKCEAYIEAGLVKVDGRVVTTMGTKVTGDEIITFRNRTVRPESRKRYVALNKPKGYVCTNDDPEQRPIAGDLLKNVYHERLFHVGRLDVNSEGLILYSNDGDFAQAVSHPSSKIEKEYLVETPARVSEETMERFVRGINYQGVHYRIEGYEILGPHRVKLRLFEGKNREIRELFRYAGYRVSALKRIRVGIVTLKSIPKIGYRDLTQYERDWFFKRRAAE